MNEKTFLSRANGSGRNHARTRKFDTDDYQKWLIAVSDAVDSAAKGEPYFYDHDAGNVVKSYKYKFSTARCWARARTDGTVSAGVDRPQCWPGNPVPCVYAGGERAYHDDWRAVQQAV